MVPNPRREAGGRDRTSVLGRRIGSVMRLGRWCTHDRPPSLHEAGSSGPRPNGHRRRGEGTRARCSAPVKRNDRPDPPAATLCCEPTAGGADERLCSIRVSGDPISPWGTCPERPALRRARRSSSARSPRERSASSRSHLLFRHRGCPPAPSGGETGDPSFTRSPTLPRSRVGTRDPIPPPLSADDPTASIGRALVSPVGRSGEGEAVRPRPAGAPPVDPRRTHGPLALGR